MIRIDKSAFSAEELAQYEALIAKAKVDPEAAGEEMEDEKPTVPPKKAEKAEEKKPAPEMESALKRLEDLEKSIAMKEFTEIAKKYAPLGENEEELAKTLFDMKKADEAVYKSYIAVLDKSMGLVEKSGLFAEIGKSAGGQSVAGGVEAKAEAKAKEIMKSEDVDYTTAIAKAWEDPALMAEYDAEYQR